MHRTRPLRALLLCLAILSLGGCGESDQGRGGRGALASSFNADSLLLLTLVEEVRIGSADDPNYGFSRIGGVRRRAAVDRDGNVYIFEQADREIRVYSPDGALLRRLGRPGDGPGEFQSSNVGIGVVGDTVWAMDWPIRAGRLVLFHREGGVISTRQVEHHPVGPPEGVGALGPVWMTDTGLFTGNVQPYLAPFSPAVLTEPVEVPIVRFSAEGEVVDTVGSYLYPPSRPVQWIQVGRGEYTLLQPADSEPLLLVVADGTISIERPIAEIGQEGVFVVTRRDFSGETLYRQTFSYEPVAYSDSILQHRAGMASRPGAGEISVSSTGDIVRRLDRLPEDSARAHAAILREMDFPPFLPPISGTVGGAPNFVGEDGTLWMRRDDGRTDEGLDRWLGLNPDGSLIGALHLQPSVQIVWSGERTMWIVERDDLGIPWLVRYRLEG